MGGTVSRNATNGAEQQQQPKKVVLITGASSGIGHATALALAQTEDFVVYGAARRPLPQDLLMAGVQPLQVDLRDTAQREAVVQQVLQEQDGRIDILINNAGYAAVGPAELLGLAEARRNFEVNFWAAVHLTQLVLPHMRGDGRATSKGLIVNISSILGKTYVPFASAYVASKHALKGWSDSLRSEVESLGVRVVLIEPGFVATDFKRVALQDGAVVQSANGTPYAYAIRRVVQLLNWTEPRFWSSPDVIARTILRACTVQRPGHRYVTGWLARPMLWAQHWGGTGLLNLAYHFVMKLPWPDRLEGHNDKDISKVAEEKKDD